MCGRLEELFVNFGCLGVCDKVLDVYSRLSTINDER